MAGSWLLALVVPPESEGRSVRYKHSASDTTNSEPAGHAEVTTGDDHHRALNDNGYHDYDDDDDDGDDDLNRRKI